MTALIGLQGVSLHYGARRVLHQVDFQVARGEIVTIVGPNGSGKTSLLKLIIGALPPTAGQINRPSRVRIGYVPQRVMFDTTLPMTLARFLSLPTGHPTARLKATLRDVDLPEHCLKQQAHSLSGGQFQRALLARALLSSPELLILDEPTQGLDQSGSARFYEVLESARTRLGCGVLMVSHELHVVMATSDRVICLNGHICCQGAPSQVASAPEYRALFGRGTKGTLALYRHSHDHSHEGASK